MDVKDRIFSQKVSGRCCSEILAAMCLEDMGRDASGDNDFVKAMGGFCEGMDEGLLCGTLAAAVGVLFVAGEDKRTAATELAPELRSWFYDSFGAYTCGELLGGEEMRKISFCPGMVADTYLKLREMLEDLGAVE
jgi:hypothetical protein